MLICDASAPLCCLNMILGFVIAPYSNLVGMPIDLIISDYTLSVEMKIIEGVAILSLNVSKLIYNNTFLKSYVSKKKV